mmetsp:Transcript_37116/g.119299  ORF Transcript_37116/g.119299 Transcript_37116/m.119299 type:complete len:179 (-) Transcript_37116:1942-2478(-)
MHAASLPPPCSRSAVLSRLCVCASTLGRRFAVCCVSPHAPHDLAQLLFVIGALHAVCEDCTISAQLPISSSHAFPARARPPSRCAAPTFAGACLWPSCLAMRSPSLAGGPGGLAPPPRRPEAATQSPHARLHSPFMNTALTLHSPLLAQSSHAACMSWHSGAAAPPHTPQALLHVFCI